MVAMDIMFEWHEQYLMSEALRVTYEKYATRVMDVVVYGFHKCFF